MDPIEQKHHATMNALAEALSEALPGYGFALLVFDFDKIEAGRMNYISNAQRPDMIVTLKEMIAQLEGRVHDSGRA